MTLHHPSDAEIPPETFRKRDLLWLPLIIVAFVIHWVWELTAGTNYDR